MKYALVLNDMRWPHVENVAIVRLSETRQELVMWYTKQLAGSPYSDGRWMKAFKSASDLEWYNPADLQTTNDYWGGIWTVADDAQVGDALVKGHR